MGKNWYVEILVDGRRIAKKYEGINAGTSPEARHKNAERLLRKLKKEAAQLPACIDEKEQLYQSLFIHQPNLRKKSFQTYKSKLDVLFRWIGTGSLTVERLQTYFQEYRQSHSQQGTYDTRIKLLAVFKLAGLQHLLEPISIRKGESQPLKYFQKHQRRELLLYLQKNDPKLFLHCLFIYFTGIRPRSELVKIKVGDIYWEKRRILVSGNFSKNHKTQFVGISKEFCPYIEHLRGLPPSQYIFHSKCDKFKPAGYNTYGDRFRAVLDQFNYSGEYQLYSWKHTGAINVYEQTKDIIALKHWCRHTDVRTTQLYLRQLGADDFAEFYERFPSPF